VIRRGQHAVLGGSARDLVEFSVSLQGRIDDLHTAVDEVAAGLSRVDRRVDGAVTNTAVVRYDAYEGTGGQQSASFALLDQTRSGVVVTAIARELAGFVWAIGQVVRPATPGAG